MKNNETIKYFKEKFSNMKKPPGKLLNQVTMTTIIFNKTNKGQAINCPNNGNIPNIANNKLRIKITGKKGKIKIFVKGAIIETI